MGKAVSDPAAVSKRSGHFPLRGGAFKASDAAGNGLRLPGAGRVPGFKGYSGGSLEEQKGFKIDFLAQFSFDHTLLFSEGLTLQTKAERRACQWLHMLI